MYTFIAEKYSSLFPLEHEVVQFISSYCTKRDAAILDIGCAVGDLAIALGKKGFTVTGIDLNEQMVKRAQDKAAGMFLNIDFKTMNMMEINTDTTYDCVVCLGNTLPHLSSWEELKGLLAILHRIIKQGGYFIFQILNYDNILHEQKVHFNTIENDEYRFNRHYSKITEQEILFEIYLYDKQTSKTHSGTTKLLPITHNRLLDCLQTSGFTEIEQFSNYIGGKAAYTDFYHLYTAKRS